MVLTTAALARHLCCRSSGRLHGPPPRLHREGKGHRLTALSSVYPEPGPGDKLGNWWRADVQARLEKWPEEIPGPRENNIGVHTNGAHSSAAREGVDTLLEQPPWTAAPRYSVSRAVRGGVCEVKADVAQRP